MGFLMPRSWAERRLLRRLVAGLELSGLVFGWLVGGEWAFSDCARLGI